MCRKTNTSGPSCHASALLAGIQLWAKQHSGCQLRARWHDRIPQPKARWHDKFAFKIFILFIWIIPLTCLAVPNDHEQPLKITSDSSFYDYKTGIKTYEGKVQIEQGTTRLIADKVITKTNAKHKIIEAIAYGMNQQAEYTTQPKLGEDEALKAKANIIKFNPETLVITLEGDVEVKQGENSFQGPLIVYNMKDQTVIAPANKSGRSTVVIDPKNHIKL